MTELAFSSLWVTIQCTQFADCKLWEGNVRAQVTEVVSCKLAHLNRVLLSSLIFLIHVT